MRTQVEFLLDADLDSVCSVYIPLIVSVADRTKAFLIAKHYFSEHNS